MRRQESLEHLSFWVLRTSTEANYMSLHYPESVCEVFEVRAQFR